MHKDTFEIFIDGQKIEDGLLMKVNANRFYIGNASIVTGDYVVAGDGHDFVAVITDCWATTEERAKQWTKYAPRFLKVGNFEYYCTVDKIERDVEWGVDYGTVEITLKWVVLNRCEEE